jgi:hypothetical protein
MGILGNRSSGSPARRSRQFEALGMVGGTHDGHVARLRTGAGAGWLRADRMGDSLWAAWSFWPPTGVAEPCARLQFGGELLSEPGRSFQPIRFGAFTG